MSALPLTSRPAQAILAGLSRANTRLMHCSKRRAQLHGYSITSSARASRDRVARARHHRQRIAQTQRSNPVAPALEIRIFGKEPGGSLLNGTREGLLNLIVGGGTDNNELQTEATRR